MAYLYLNFTYRWTFLSFSISRIEYLLDELLVEYFPDVPDATDIVSDGAYRRGLLCIY